MAQDPDDAKEFRAQVMAEPGQWHFDFGAVTPEVIIKDETQPREHEIYNCTTCKYGRLLPDRKIPEGGYIARCLWKVDAPLEIGDKFADKGCQWFRPKNPRPRKGYMPGVES